MLHGIKHVGFTPAVLPHSDVDRGLASPVVSFTVVWKQSQTSLLTDLSPLLFRYPHRAETPVAVHSSQATCFRFGHLITQLDRLSYCPANAHSLTPCCPTGQYTPALLTALVSPPHFSPPAQLLFLCSVRAWWFICALLRPQWSETMVFIPSENG